jgi:peroxiredoxin Q/BCP
VFDWLLSDPLPLGTPAPEFELQDHAGRTVRLADYRGRNVILVFYPADETTVCRRQLCEFRDKWPDLESRNTVLFGINGQSAASHAKFVENRQFPFPLLVDKGQKVGALYGAKGLIVKRTVYLIGPDGVIRFAQRGTPAPDQVLAAAVRDSG